MSKWTRPLSGPSKTLLWEKIDITSTESKYFKMKYQTCDPVSISKNWKPVGVMEGSSKPSL